MGIHWGHATLHMCCTIIELPKCKFKHSTKKPVPTMLTYPWKCTVLHCNHLGNTWKPLVLMTRHFDYCPSASEGDNQSVRSSAPVVSRCFPGGYNVNLYISRGRLAWWLLAFLHSVSHFLSHFNETTKIVYGSILVIRSCQSCYCPTQTELRMAFGNCRSLWDLMILVLVRTFSVIYDYAFFCAYKVQDQRWG